MRIARPSTLWRFLSGELWKLLFVTALVMVVVFSFALAIKPLADGRISSLDALWLMALAAVPMLQYALPFAAGFAATLSYHRMAQDNELTAVYAGGMSHRAVLVPAMISGAVLSVALLLMADQAMPRFWRKIQEIVTNDFTRLISSSIARGQSLVAPDGRRVLYADKLIEREVDPVAASAGAVKHFILLGVVVIERKIGTGLAWQASAARASVTVYRGGDDQESEERGRSLTVVMRLADSVGGKKGGTTGQAGESTLSFVVPSEWREDPKFFSFAEMTKALNDPRRLSDAAALHRGVASMLAERSAADRLRATLERDGRATMSDLSGRTVMIRAAGLARVPGIASGTLSEGVTSATPTAKDGFALLAKGGWIEARTTLEDGRVRVQRARRAWASVPPALEGEASLLSIRMQEVTTSGGGSEAEPTTEPSGEGEGGAVAGVIKEYEIPNLRLSDDPLPGLVAMSSEELRTKARQRLSSEPQDKSLASALARYDSAVINGEREVLSKLHERIAAAMVSGLMVVLGAVMGMRLGSSYPLAVYLWSFLPALGAVLLISGGQRAMAAWGAPGLVIIYGGALAMGLLTFAQYRALKWT
ncbi:MAG: LptF/LptG family permease [Phycisphaerales bacterium]|nr:LptF/LptG family permease [Phycisphaerales bacterium]